MTMNLRTKSILLMMLTGFAALTFAATAVIGYELFGDVPYKTGASQTYRERVVTLTTNLIWHQNGGGGALPTNRVDGGLGDRHDPRNGETPDRIGLRPGVSGNRNR